MGSEYLSTELVYGFHNMKQIMLFHTGFFRESLAELEF